MAGREAVRKTLQQVRPILSVDNDEARRRVLSLYKAWYRQVPYIGKYKFSFIRVQHSCYIIHPLLLRERECHYTAASTHNIMIFIHCNKMIFQCKYFVCNTTITVNQALF